MEVIPEESAHTRHRPLELLLVLRRHGPGRGELLHVLDGDWPHLAQGLEKHSLNILFQNKTVATLITLIPFTTQIKSEVRHNKHQILVSSLNLDTKLWKIIISFYSL